MQTSACLVRRIVELTACVKRREHQTLCTDSFLMESNRNASSVILDGGRSVCLERYPDFVTVTGKMFVHGIVYDFINQMV